MTFTSTTSCFTAVCSPGSWIGTRNGTFDEATRGVHLAFDVTSMVALGRNTVDPAALQLLDDALAVIDPATVDGYWAHDALRLVDLLIRRSHHAAAYALIDFAISRAPS